MNWSHAGLRPHYPAHGESHRKTQMHTDSIRCGSATPWSDLRPGGARLWMRGMLQIKAACRPVPF